MSDCDPMNCSLPGFSVHGILQARVMEWVANSFSRDLPPEDLPSPGIEPGSPALQADSLPFEPPGKPTLILCLLQVFETSRANPGGIMYRKGTLFHLCFT